MNEREQGFLEATYGLHVHSYSCIVPQRMWRLLRSIYTRDESLPQRWFLYNSEQQPSLLQLYVVVRMAEKAVPCRHVCWLVYKSIEVELWEHGCARPDLVSRIQLQQKHIF
jgi:hypothetical protein